MRRSKEVMVLLALLVGAMGFVLWYVIDRRAKNRAAPAPEARAVAPAPAPALEPGPAPVGTKTVSPPAKEVLLGTAETEKKTVDFSSGKPVVKDSAEDQAAIAEALKDIAAAANEVTFEPAAKTATPPAPPARKQ